jgi:hypothetical protein
MVALASVWIGLIAFVAALVMVVYRPAFTDWTVLLVAYFGAPGALCLAGMVLWAHRKEPAADPAVAGQRRQAKIAIGLAVLAAAIVYGLVIFAQQVSVEDGRGAP